MPRMPKSDTSIHFQSSFPGTKNRIQESQPCAQTYLCQCCKHANCVALERVLARACMHPWNAIADNQHSEPFKTRWLPRKMARQSMHAQADVKQRFPTHSNCFVCRLPNKHGERDTHEHAVDAVRTQTNVNAQNLVIS